MAGGLYTRTNVSNHWAIVSSCIHILALLSLSFSYIFFSNLSQRDPETLIKASLSSTFSTPNPFSLLHYKLLYFYSFFTFFFFCWVPQPANPANSARVIIKSSPSSNTSSYPFHFPSGSHSFTLSLAFTLSISLCFSYSFYSSL